MLQRLALRDWGARFALLAVWLQLALSFGHVHPQDVYGPLGHAVVQGHGVTAVSAPVPSGQNPSGGLAGIAEDACAICESIALLSTAALPDPVRLPPPPPAAITSIREIADLAIAPAPFSLFQTRAPPAV